MVLAHILGYGRFHIIDVDMIAGRSLFYDVGSDHPSPSGLLVLDWYNTSTTCAIQVIMSPLYNIRS